LCSLFIEIVAKTTTRTGISSPEYIDTREIPPHPESHTVQSGTSPGCANWYYHNRNRGDRSPTRGFIKKYSCYFLTTEGKVGLSFLVETETPHAAAAEVLARTDGHSFPTLEVWDGPVCALSLDGRNVHTPLANPQQTQAEVRDGKKRRVMVVDDYPAIRLFTADILREQGYYVYESGSGQGALELLTRGVKVEILVTDVRMPDMSGYDLAERVIAEAPAIKVLYTTAFDRAHGETHAQRPGSVLRKPFLATELIEAVALALGD
jgi:CheY-like chemotaxis protein